MAKNEQKVTKVILYVEGGCVQSVHADGPVDITIVDKDELVEYGLIEKERKALLKKTLKGCKPTYNWGFVPNPKNN